MKCSHCPLLGSDKPCHPAVDDPGYCGRIAREQTQPVEHQYWTQKLLRQSELPPRKSNYCDPNSPLVFKPRQKNLAKELVIAKYKEDVAWVNTSPMPTIVYDKCPGSHDLVYADHVVERHIPNRGREAGTWLEHICEHYDDLASWTFFVQGTPHSSDLFGRLAVDYTKATSLTKHYMETIPSEEIKAFDLVEEVGGYPVRYGLANFFGVGQWTDRNEEWVANCWQAWFACPVPEKLYFGFGAEWAVPSKAIRARPLQFWQTLREAVNRSSPDEAISRADPASPWALELLWRYLFDDPKTYPLHSMPSMLTRIKSLGKAVVNQVAAGMPMASKELQAERKAVCYACPLLDKQRDVCNKCGCVAMNLKRSWLTSKCPEGKW